MSVAISCTYITQTAHAICVVESESGEEVWLPKSQIEVDYDEDIDGQLAEGELLDVVIPKWLAEEKELI